MEIGSKWNGWTIEKKLGTGSFGTVYKITKVEFNHHYESALKVISIPQNESELSTIRSEGMDDDSVTEYFRGMVENITEELALMSKLKGNTNIVSYEYHLVREKEDSFGWDVFVQMELLTPLNEYIQNHTLTIREVIQLGIDMCQALEVCQKYNIIHRDIKPENIFVSDLGRFKLGDFGIARQMEKASIVMSKKGTYTYMAPEIYKGLSYNSTVDIYSLGIVLYRFLNNNRTPFMPPYPQKIKYSDREKANVLRISGKAIPKPCNAEGRLAEIVLKACSYNPTERYESAVDMKEALESINYSEKESAVIYPNGDSLPNEKTSTIKSDNVAVAPNFELDKTAEGTVFLFQSEAEKAKQAAEAKARLEAEERARKAAEEKARKEAEERARRAAAEKARREAEEHARREAAEKARREAEEKARREAEELARKQAEERARKEAEERARLEAIERAKKEEEERRKREAEEKARKAAEEKARIEAEKKAKKEAAEKARKEAEQQKRKEAAEQAKRKAEEKARIEAEKKAKKEAAEKARKEAEQRRKKETEEQAKRKAAEKARIESEKKAKKEAAEKARQKALAEKKEATKKAKTEKKANKKPIVIGIIIAAALVLGVIIFAMCSSSQKITVPDVVGLSKTDAISELDKVGIKYSFESEYSDNVKENFIISQNIKAGKTVEKDSNIKLIVSKGVELVSVPDVVGKKESDATKQLEDKGFSVSISRKYSASVAKGNVISQNPDKGDIAKGSKVEIVISKREKLYKVPNVKGLSESKAKSTLRKAKLKVKVKTAYSNSTVKGKVIKQSIASGKKVKKNTVITITVSKGAKPVMQSETYSNNDNNNSYSYNENYSNNNSGSSDSQIPKTNDFFS